MVIGPTPLGTGVMWDAMSLACYKIDITDQFAIDSIDTDVNDNSTRFDHASGHQIGFAGCDNQNIRIQGVRS